MTVILWILNIVLALVFLASGLFKATQPTDVLVARGLKWAAGFRPSLVTGIGLVEVVGAIGLFLPKLTGLAPVLTPLASVGLLATMICAIVLHQRRRESYLPALVLAVLCAISAVLGFILI
ncbi:MAG: DoxX family rane protein [Frondihabitans sp.]|nr:DoxX family rane protein [Frondihabitans sp.]